MFIIPNKKDPEGSNLINGASGGLLAEPLIQFIYIIKTEECQIIENNIFDLVA